MDRARTTTLRTGPLRRARRPHVLGIDDGPFRKHVGGSAPVAGVMTEGADLVEAVALTRFPVDGDAATQFLAEWVGGLRCWAGLQAVVLGGITLAGLGVVEIAPLAKRLGVPVLVVNRRDPADHRLEQALRAAGLEDRIPAVAGTPPARALAPGLFVSWAGADEARAAELVAASRRKSALPEPLRLAHLIARAVATGESRGRP